MHLDRMLPLPTWLDKSEEISKFSSQNEIHNSALLSKVAFSFPLDYIFKGKD